MKKLLLLLLLSLVGCSAPYTKSNLVPNRQTSSEEPNPLQRKYILGEVLNYQLTMSHSFDGKLISSYDVLASGTVKQDNHGIYFEEFQWLKVINDEKKIRLSPAGQNLKQRLSLAPNSKLGIPPELPTLDQELIGPVTDLLTFYVDEYLAVRQATLRKQGDHVFLKTSAASSWGSGQDCLDFDITLLKLDTQMQEAVLKVSHIPPAAICITPPASWMKTQVTDTPNNWFDVQKKVDQWNASSGKETFDVILKVDLTSGVIRSATMDNPIDFESRDCSDEKLTSCSDPKKHRVARKLTLTLDPKSRAQ